jgi:hypothetical protein
MNLRWPPLPAKVAEATRSIAIVAAMVHKSTKLFRSFALVTTKQQVS